MRLRRAEGGRDIQIETKLAINILRVAPEMKENPYIKHLRNGGKKRGEIFLPLILRERK